MRALRLKQILRASPIVGVPLLCSFSINCGTGPSAIDMSYDGDSSFRDGDVGGTEQLFAEHAGVFSVGSAQYCVHYTATATNSCTFVAKRASATSAAVAGTCRVFRTSGDAGSGTKTLTFNCYTSDAAPVPCTGAGTSNEYVSMATDTDFGALAASTDSVEGKVITDQSTPPTTLTLHASPTYCDDSFKLAP